jgi:hypothetical protein
VNKYFAILSFQLFLPCALVAQTDPPASPAPSDALGGLQSLYPWPEDPANLVLNPSFEEVDSFGKPRGWILGSSPHLFRGIGARSGQWALHLEDSDQDRFTPNARQAMPLDAGWYSFRGWARAVAAGTQVSGSGGRISLSGAGSTDVISGTTDWIRLERRDVPVSPGDAPVLRIEAYRKPDGSVFFDDVEVHRLAPAPVEGFLRYPNYRGALFADRSQQILMGVMVRPEELGRAATNLLVRLSLETTDGVVIASHDSQGLSGSTVLSLDASGAPLGRFNLRLQAVDPAEGTVLYEYPSYSVVKLSTEEREGLRLYVDPDNTAVIEGQRRFVLGIYDTTGYSLQPSAYEPRIAKIAEAPLNMYVNYWLGRAPDAALKALMTTLQAHGMKYLHTVNTWYEDGTDWTLHPSCDGQTPASLGEAAYTICRAKSLGLDGGLAGWYTADERAAEDASPVFQQYARLRQNDPDGVTFVAQNRPRELSRWRDATDVMGVDPYPIYNIPEGSLSPLEMVTDWVDQARGATEGSRPVWAVVQYFPFGSKGHWPTYDELRTMSYMGIVAGARGLFYWSYGTKGLSSEPDLGKREEYWQRLVRVTQEIHSLESVLLQPDAVGVVSGIAPEAGIRWVAKEWGGARYLIAVNNTPQPAVGVTFTLADEAGPIEVIGEQRMITPSGKAFADLFQPYEAHVYRIATADLVANGGFEFVDSLGRPLSWRLGTAAWSDVGDEAHSGDRSLRLQGADSASYMPSAQARSVWLEPGVYILRGRVKAESLGVTGTTAIRGVRLSLRDESRSGNKNIATTGIVSGTTAWVPIETRVQIHTAGLFTPTVEAYAKPAGTAWIDQVSLMREP